MQKSEKFFIFSWKELLVLILVAITAIGFFFTLGLHYGKKLGEEFKPVEPHVATLEQSPEAAPPRDALEQGGHRSGAEAEKTVQEATLKGLEENQMKVDHPRPLDLPGTRETKEAPEKKEEKQAEKQTEEPPGAAAPVIEEARTFGIQLGSYPSAKEARKRVALFGKRGLKTEIRTANVAGETRYRVVLPGFKSWKAAESRAKELQGARKVESFVVIRL
jgi:cell division protein FtsN